MINKEQINLLIHTLGSKNPNKWYRNHFVAGPNHSDLNDLYYLEEKGYMKRLTAPSFCHKDDIIFCVTEEGKSFLKNEPISKTTS